MKSKRIKINKKQPIFRIPKMWIDPEGEKRTNIPILITFEPDKIVIKKELQVK